MVGFQCAYCHAGFSVMDVEQYFNKKTNKNTFLCKSHLSSCPPYFIHLPWDDVEGQQCLICKKTGGKCYTGNSNIKKNNIVFKDTIYSSIK